METAHTNRCLLTQGPLCTAVRYLLTPPPLVPVSISEEITEGGVSAA